MNDIGVVQCDRHGQVQAAYLCQHLLAGLTDRSPRGVNWVTDENDAVNAWCDGCESYLLANGNEWNDRTEAHAQIKLVCRNCFDDFESFDTLKEAN
ncbi:hypothetical protein [Roseobacter ponti]|uniref:Uncharacterized protein n=1 Tax=Roseobacter ponti TaxID=1891787 RepID=A0A858SR57_9RHOB|nr:hypothetical protein [Roseobacter ponti]QJF50850.1 hypothetical protein G3256_06605 [Roseobacter ponti]